MPDDTDNMKAVSDAATLLAKTEYEGSKALLAKLTTFITDVNAIRDNLGYPAAFQSPLCQTLTQIAQNNSFARDNDLPMKIAAYEAAQRPPITTTNTMPSN